MNKELKDNLRHNNHEAMRYFIEIDGKNITTHSVRVAAQMKERKIASNIINDGKICGIRIHYNDMHDGMVEGIACAINEQIKTDQMQLCLYNIDGEDVVMDQVEQAKDGETQCHESSEVNYDEVAWGNVNECKLDPIKVRQARRAEMEFLKKMQVHKKVPKQTCRDVTGRGPIKVRWVDTNKQGEANPKYRSRLVVKEF